jgi:hypothetical protein
MWAAVAVVALVFAMYGVGKTVSKCPGSQVYCPGVGCLSGWDKCVAGSKGGPSVIFSQEPFENWPGVGVASKPPTYGKVKEGFEMPAPRKKTCAGNYRSDGPCLMDF